MSRQVVLALACIGLGAQARTREDIPRELAGYRDWRTLGGSARPVSIPVSVLCAYLPPDELQKRVESAKRDQGPHAERYVRAYANPVAVEALLDPAAKAFRPGAVLVKEKLKGPSDDVPEGVAFMIKRPEGFAESGGWEFRYYPRSGEGSYAGCVECHREGASRDYVFGRLGAKPQEGK